MREKAERLGADRLTASLVYGRRPVIEALRANSPVSKVWVAWGARPEGLADIQGLAHQRHIPVEPVPRERLDHLAGPHHQGVVAWVAPLPYLPLSELLHRLTEVIQTGRTRRLTSSVASRPAPSDEDGGAGPGADVGDGAAVDAGVAAGAGVSWPPLVLVLDEIQDPHNLGALLRTAEGAGVDAVVVPEHRAVGLTDAVAKAAAGAQQWLPVVRVGSLTQALAEFKKIGLWVVGSADQASSLAYETDLSGPLALVVGSEGRGLRRTIASACDLVTRLPMLGHVESLNASVAGGVLLYEVFRQRWVASRGQTLPVVSRQRNLS